MAKSTDGKTKVSTSAQIRTLPERRGYAIYERADTGREDSYWRGENGYQAKDWHAAEVYDTPEHVARVLGRPVVRYSDPVPAR